MPHLRTVQSGNLGLHHLNVCFKRDFIYNPQGNIPTKIALEIVHNKLLVFRHTGA